MNALFNEELLPKRGPLQKASEVDVPDIPPFKQQIEPTEPPANAAIATAIDDADKDVKRQPVNTRTEEVDEMNALFDEELLPKRGPMQKSSEPDTPAEQSRSAAIAEAMKDADTLIE